MEAVITLTKRINFGRVDIKLTAVFLGLAVMVLIGQIHFFYPDELENILGGRYIIEGRLPYIGFFTHHNPFAYFFSVPLYLLSGQSFVKFRLLLGLVYIGMMAGLYLWIKRRLGVEIGKITLIWLVFVVVGATYWWGQMLLADSLSSYLIVVPVMLLFWLIWKKESLKRNDLWLISVLAAFALLTTFTLLYLVLTVYIFTIIYYFKTSPVKLWSKETLKVGGILALPYLIFMVYLIVTGSLEEYYYQSILFNTQYYATLPGGVSVKNPLRVIIVLFYQFFVNFKTILVMVKDLNFGSPFAQTMALSNAILFLYCFIEKKYFLAVFVWLALTFGIVRSNPYTTAETDYQGMAYHLISIFNGLVALNFLWKVLKEKTFDGKFLLYGGGFPLLSLYFLFFGLHLSDKYLEKAYQKYMGTQSLIYDRPSVAFTLNRLLDKNDYYFLGPFDFENHFYTRAKLASKYIVVIPAMSHSEKIQKEMLTDLQNNKPKVVVYDTEMRVFGDKPGSYVVSFLNDNYFNLEHLGAPCINFKAATKWYGTYDFERHFFFRNENQQEMIAKLSEQRLIEPVDPGNLPAFCRERLKESTPSSANIPKI